MYFLEDLENDVYKQEFGCLLFIVNKDIVNNDIINDYFIVIENV